jgi:DinB superfamily
MQPDIQRLDDEFNAVKRDAQALIGGLSEAQAGWRAQTGSWSVSECLDHLATANRAYLRAMRPAAKHAREQGRLRRRPAVPGVVGGWFVRSFEPPARFKIKAPREIQPRTALALEDAFAAFAASHAEICDFLRANADLDLASVRFRNPFIKGVRFRLATGLHILAAHERRHLWQAWRVREAIPKT